MNTRKPYSELIINQHQTSIEDIPQHVRTRLWNPDEALSKELIKEYQAAVVVVYRQILLKQSAGREVFEIHESVKSYAATGPERDGKLDPAQVRAVNDGAESNLTQLVRKLNLQLQAAAETGKVIAAAGRSVNSAANKMAQGIGELITEISTLKIPNC